MTDTATTPDLRERIEAALRDTPSKLLADPGFRDELPEQYRIHRTTEGGPGHNYDATCALCRGEADTLAGAMLAVVQPALDKAQRRGDIWKTKAQEIERDRDRYVDFVWAVRPAFDRWLAGDPATDLMTILRRSFEELDAKAPKPPTPSYEEQQ